MATSIRFALYFILMIWISQIIPIIKATVYYSKNSARYGKDTNKNNLLFPPPPSSVSNSKLQKMGKSDFLHLKSKGGGGGENMVNIALPGEPSCEELRAMWRYYKRQSRKAVLTNEIPQMQLIWDFPGEFGRGKEGKMRSFAGGSANRGRSYMRNNPKGMRKFVNNSPVYGKMVNKPGRGPLGGRRPMDEVYQMFGTGGGGKKVGFIEEPVVHFSPPPRPKEVTGLEKLREEMKSSNPSPPTSPVQSGDEKEFGKVLLSPPTGQDGRAANKPKELMTSFEKIRFGHANNLLDNPPSSNFMLEKEKRRSTLLKPESFSDNEDSLRYDIEGQDLSYGEKSEDFMPKIENILRNRPQSYTYIDETPDAVYYDEERSPVVGGGRETSPFAAKEPMMVEELPVCNQIEGNRCFANSDCACVGSNLFRCHRGQCQVLSLISERGREEIWSDSGKGEVESVWHSGPVHSSHLGIWENLKPHNQEEESEYSYANINYT